MVLTGFFHWMRFTFHSKRGSTLSGGIKYKEEREFFKANIALYFTLLRLTKFKYSLMIINTSYDLCLQSVSWYLQLQLICNRWLPRKHLSNSIPNWTEPEPYIYTEVELNTNLIFLNYSEPKENRTIIIKVPEPNVNPKFLVLFHL